MAFRTWGRVLLAALGVGVVAGAGQLGLAYGLGLVRFARAFDTAATDQWAAQLAWVGWFAMVAAVAGAVAGDRMASRYDLPGTFGARVGYSAAAALGALAVAPLSMQPARAAQITSVDPVVVAGVTAVTGAVVGLLAALAVLSQRPIGWNVAALTGAVWLLALLSVMPSLGPTDPLPEVRLGVLDATWLSRGTAQRLAVITMPGLALVAGAGTGALARWRGRSLPVVATSGAVGPAMLALAYLIAGAGGGADNYQVAPYWGALIAAGAGGLGSVLAAMARWPLVAGGSGAPTGAAGGLDVPHPARPGDEPRDPSLAGETGPDGRPSTAGPDGRPSTAGPDGRPSTAGPDGRPGSTWDTRPDGRSGTAWDAGPDEPSGSTWDPGIRRFGGQVSSARDVPAPRSSTEQLGTAGQPGTAVGQPGSAVGQPGSAAGPAAPTGDPSPGAPPPGRSTPSDLYRRPASRTGRPADGPTPPGGPAPAGRPTVSDAPTAGGFPGTGAEPRRPTTADFWPTAANPALADPPPAPDPPVTVPAPVNLPVVGPPPVDPRPAGPAPVNPPPASPAPVNPPPVSPPPVNPPPVSPPPVTSGAAAGPLGAPPSPRSVDDWDAFAPRNRPSVARTGSARDHPTRTDPDRPGQGPIRTNRTEPHRPGQDPAESTRTGDARDAAGAGDRAGPGTARTDSGRTDTARTDTARAGTRRGRTAQADPDPGDGDRADQTGTDPGPASAEAAGPPAPTRRGLFRRNRSKEPAERPPAGEAAAAPAEPGPKTGPSQKAEPGPKTGPSQKAEPGPKTGPSQKAEPGPKTEPRQKEPKGRNRAEQPVPARDEEYVDWVSGLSEPGPEEESGLEGRRSLRSSGRHHVE